MDPLDYWTAQADGYAPPHGRGVIGLTARRQHATVLNLLAPRGGERVLDAGCGTGLLTRALAARGARVWAVDFCPAMVAKVSGAEKVVCADLETLELNTQFEAVVCAGALNFVDLSRTLERLAAHARDGGLVVVTVARPSLLGLCYVATRKLLGVRFRLWSERSIRAAAHENGLDLIARETTLPHDVALAFRRRDRRR